MKHKILIATTSFGRDDPGPLEQCKKGNDVVTNQSGRKLEERKLLSLGGDADGIIAGTEMYDKPVLEKLRRLKVISRCGTGMDNIDLDAASALGIKVYNTPDAPTVAVAELTIGLILDLLRMVTPMDRSLRTGIWDKKAGYLLKGKKVGIIGFGRIGKKVAGFLKAFETEVAYYDIAFNEVGGHRYMPLSELLPWADIITMHCSAPSAGKAVIGKDELRLLSKDAFLVNTSRGGVIDEKALHDSLKEGWLKGAALDVFEKEPYLGPLRELDNVILTPHIGSYARESRIEMEMQAVRNLLEGLKTIKSR